MSQTPGGREGGRVPWKTREIGPVESRAPAAHGFPSLVGIGGRLDTFALASTDGSIY